MNPSLAEQQKALLQALRRPGHESAAAFVASYRGLLADVNSGQWRRGITAYRSNGHELARRALQGAYPAVAQLLGEENFAALARSLWAANPPSRGDVAQWGGELAAHIESLADLAREEPFLPDVARVEWLLHLAATAANGRLDGHSLQLLTTHDPASFTLLLCPGCGFVMSGHPVVSIVNAHITGEPSLKEAGQRLREGRVETAIVWREGLKPRLREAVGEEADFIAALQERRSLADSLQAAPTLDFSAWLANAAQSGLLVGAEAL